MDEKPSEESYAGSVEEETEQITNDLEEARREAAEYLDSLQRLKAEFENYRKRMLREQSEYLTMASQGLILELLPVLDNFERALSHAAEAEAGDFGSGVQLLYNQLIDIMAKQGLTAIDPIGEPFDPLRHEALMQTDSEDHEENIIVEVFDKGYELKGRVIRPAKVKVSQ